MEKPVLRCIKGHYADNVIDLDARPLAIGRDPARSNLILPETAEDVSGLHCVLMVKPQRHVFLLEDMHSTNGTFIIGRGKLEPDHKSILKSGDRFYLVNESELFEVRFEDEPDEGDELDESESDGKVVPVKGNDSHEFDSEEKKKPVEDKADSCAQDKDNRTLDDNRRVDERCRKEEPHEGPLEAWFNKLGRTIGLVSFIAVAGFILGYKYADEPLDFSPIERGLMWAILPQFLVVPLAIWSLLPEIVKNILKFLLGILILIGIIGKCSELIW